MTRVEKVDAITTQEVKKQKKQEETKKADTELQTLLGNKDAQKARREELIDDYLGLGLTKRQAKKAAKNQVKNEVTQEKVDRTIVYFDKDEYEKNTGKKIDGEVLCPFFKEGGRFTIDDVHYVQYDDTLVPAAETEFAKDKTFGYTVSNLKEYVEEKTQGAYKKENVTAISLENIRELNYDKIEEQLLAVEDFNKVIVNAIDYVDVKIFCVALFRAMKKGKNFMFRTAAAIVKVMGGVSNQPLLTREQMVVKETDNGGIIVVGSHTDKTTRQMEKLRENKDIAFVELNATLVNDEAAFAEEVERCLALEEEYISSGKSVCVYTTRALITADTGDKEDDLRLSVRISDAVQSLVGRLTVTPSFVIAKGGITSSDVGTKALAVTRANVLGQIRPGIPVWQTGTESKFPLTPYVIFPGNVGGDTTLKEAVEILMKTK